jgi:hypothetical protein
MDKRAKGVVLIVVSKVCERAEKRTSARIVDANGIRSCAGGRKTPYYCCNFPDDLTSRISQAPDTGLSRHLILKK